MASGAVPGPRTIHRYIRRYPASVWSGEAAVSVAACAHEKKECCSIMQSTIARLPWLYRCLAALVFSFGAVLSAGVLSATAQAQDSPVPTPALPAGSYALSCNSCSASGSELTCQCADAVGQSGTTSLPLPCSAPIENCNGDLTCGACPALPAGSYLQTCEGCNAGRSELTCWCYSVCGQLKPTSIDLSCERELSNCNGNLTCGDC
jgi:hypothetical protein